MLVKTQNIANAYVPLQNAHTLRNQEMYNRENILVNNTNKAEDYLFTTLDSNLPQ